MMQALQQIDLPQRLADAFTAKAQLAEQQIYFAPIRHHSPACAYALKHYIEQLQPTHILIEAPQGFQGLIEDLLSTQTQPPVAIFAQAQRHVQSKAENESQDHVPQIQSAYFPFCEYSPEWIALHAGRKQQSQLVFIDLDWSDQCHFKSSLDRASPQQSNLMSERYLAHSQFIQQLAQKLHCRNHDELWDHLFELQTPEQLQNPEQFFNDVLSWCALARLDYEQDVLYREASLHREYCMYQHIETLRQPNHRLLVVTGGFHTLTLIEQLIDKTPTRYLIEQKNPHWQQQAWLIRYSFDRLDALNGYASGMPSPAYYQRLWQDLNQIEADHQIQFYDYLSLLCRELAEKQALEITPYIALKNTSELAQGLAQLRGHYRPSRYDLLDALQASLIKGEMDDGQQYLWQCIDDYLSGQILGQVAKNQHSPALLQNTYQKIQSLRFKLEDTLPKQRKLDIYRKPLHQQISQFLHLLNFLDVGFAHRLSGPDFIRGAAMDLLFEEWRYAWTPTVEARLIELSEQGDQLNALATQKLLTMQQDLQAQGLGQSAIQTAQLLAQACQLGLKQQLHLLQQKLNHYLEIDQNLASLIGAAQQLFYLWHGRQLLQLPAHALQDSIIFAIQHACYVLDQLYDTHEDKIEQNVQNLKALHELITNAQDKFDLSDLNLLDQMYQQLDMGKLDEFHLLKLKGALHTLLYLDQRISQQQLQQHIKDAFSIGSHAEDAVQYLHGILFVAPEIFVQSDLAIHTLHHLVQHWSDDIFLQILPDLRYIFSQLNPKQSQRISEKIAEYTHLQDASLLEQVYSDISEQDMLRGVALNRQLEKIFADDQLLSCLLKSAPHTPQEQVDD